MSKFSELLSKPLPSAAMKAVTEGVDEVIDTPVETPAVPPVVPTPQPAPVADADDEVGEELTPEEDKMVDDMMDSIATPLLLADEVNSEEEYKEFVESVDADILIAEGLLTERTIVKFDKNARLEQLYWVALFSIARSKKDRLQRKLDICYKMERMLKSKLTKKYGPQAERKAREYLKRAKRSKSGILSRIASKISK